MGLRYTTQPGFCHSCHSSLVIFVSSSRFFGQALKSIIPGLVLDVAKLTTLGQ